MMNLHSIARRLLLTVHPEEPCELIQCVGIVNNGGYIKSDYAEPVQITADIQPSGKDLQHEDGMDTAAETAVAFLYSNPDSPVDTLARTPLAKTGDYLKRGETYWRITAVPEDWSADGWAKVIITRDMEGLNDGGSDRGGMGFYF